MANEDGTARSAIWAIAMIIIVAIIVGGVFYMTQNEGKQKKVEIDVTAPSR